MSVDWKGDALYFDLEVSKEQFIDLMEAFRFPKYLITEASFPKKKKRGTMRRKRKIQRVKTYILTRLNEDE